MSGELDTMIDNYVDSFVNRLFDFDKSSYAFNRNEKDMHPYDVTRRRDSLILTHNVLGIAKEDLKVRIETKDWKHYLVIRGASKDIMTGKSYSINSRFGYNPAEVDVSKAESKLRNGILYITIPYKEMAEECGSIQEIEIK